MSVSTYKRWMKESYLYEADDDEGLKGKMFDDPVSKKEMSILGGLRSSNDKTKKAAQQAKDKVQGKEKGGPEPGTGTAVSGDRGPAGYDPRQGEPEPGYDPRQGEPEPKAEPKTTAISTTGGLGGDDEEGGEEEPSGEEKPSGGSTDTKEFYKDLHWQRAPSPEETQEMTKDMSDEELDELMANQEKALQSAKDWAQPQPPTFYVDPQAAGHIEGAEGRLAGLQAEKDRRAGKEPTKAEPKAEPSAAEKKEKIQGKIDQLKKEYDSVMQSAKEAGEEGDGFTQGELEKTAKEIQDEIEMLKEKLTSMGRTGTEEIKVINGKKYRAIKESVDKRISVKEVHKWLKGLEEYRYRKIPGVDARRITSFVNNGLNETDLPISLQKKWGNAKYSKEKTLADRFIKQRISQKLTQTESKHPLKEQYDRLFKNKVVL